MADKKPLCNYAGAVKELQSGDTLLGLSGRNMLVNGAMKIDQQNAGANVTSAAYSAQNNYVVDQWVVDGAGDGVFISQQNAASVPPGFSHSLKITVSVSDSSVAAGDYYRVYQPIVGYTFSRLGYGDSAAKNATFSFWIRSSLTGTFSGSVDGRAISSHGYPFTFTINSADTWEKKIVVIPGYTLDTWEKTSNAAAYLTIDLGSGSSYRTTANAWAAGVYLGVTDAVRLVGTTNATLYLGGCQFEAGDVATEFEHLDFATEFQQCQFYYETNVDYGTVPTNGVTYASVRGIGYHQATVYTAGGVTYHLLQIPFQTTKRIQPTIAIIRDSQTTTNGQWGYITTGGTATDVAITAAAQKTGMYAYCTGSLGYSHGQSIQLLGAWTANARF